MLVRCARRLLNFTIRPATESDEIEATLAAALQALDASLEQQRPRPQCAEDQVNLGERELSSEAEADWEEPPPVFADCSHYSKYRK